MASYGSCKMCKKTFEVKYLHILKRKKYCSKGCKIAFYKTLTGEKSNAWSGGIIKQRGYIYIYSPKHPSMVGPKRTGYVKRSRLIVEKNLKRYLKPSEIVHHINGIKNDDSLKNLVVTTRSSHVKEHLKDPNTKKKMLSNMKKALKIRWNNTNRLIHLKKYPQKYCRYCGIKIKRRLSCSIKCSKQYIMNHK